MRITLRSVCSIAAVIGLAAGIVTPIVSQERERMADRCMARKRDLWRAFRGYTEDYHNIAPLTNYLPGTAWNLHPPNVIHLQLLVPYSASYIAMRCPADPNAIDSVLERNSDGSLPGSQEQRLLNFAMRADAGYNSQNIAPVFSGPDRCAAISLYSVRNPQKTLLYLDSVWERDATGRPNGGGSWSIDPPCRIANGPFGLRDAFVAGIFGGQSNYWFGGWNPSRPLAWNVYGGVWPWHTANCEPRVVVIYLSGHAKTLSIPQITAGCDVKDGWGGLIYDLEAYQWDIWE